MAKAAQHAGLTHHFLGVNAVDGAHTFTHKAVVRIALGVEVNPKNHARHLMGGMAEMRLTAVQCLFMPHALGDVFYRALVVQHLAVDVAHKVGVFTDPNTLMRAVSVHLRDEIAHLTIALQRLTKLQASGWKHIPFRVQVAQRSQQLRFCVVTVQANQRRVGTNLAAIG